MDKLVSWHCALTNVHRNWTNAVQNVQGVEGSVEETLEETTESQSNEAILNWHARTIYLVLFCYDTEVPEIAVSLSTTRNYPISSLILLKEINQLGFLLTFAAFFFILFSETIIISQPINEFHQITEYGRNEYEETSKKMQRALCSISKFSPYFILDSYWIHIRLCHGRHWLAPDMTFVCVCVCSGGSLTGSFRRRGAGRGHRYPGIHSSSSVWRIDRRTRIPWTR